MVFMLDIRNNLELITIKDCCEWSVVKSATIKYVIFVISAAVVYRVPLTWTQDKLPWKILHACLLLLALIFTIVGLCAVFDYHNANNTANLYSLHSWVGILTSALFATQVWMTLVLSLSWFSKEDSI